MPPLGRDKVLCAVVSQLSLAERLSLAATQRFRESGEESSWSLLNRRLNPCARMRNSSCIGASTEARKTPALRPFLLLAPVSAHPAPETLVQEQSKVVEHKYRSLVVLG
jgi:hypothetical protein